MGFDGAVAVRELNDTEWELVEPLTYTGNSEQFVVPPGYRTDFASVPRILTWLLPRYGRYTKAAILHDFLCDEARAGRLQRSDADGMFRRAMRELGVSFLKRWLMWAAVRAGSVGEAGWKQLAHPSVGSLVALVVLTIPAVVYLAAPVVLIVLALLVWFFAEWVAWLLLKVFHRRGTDAAPPKQINRPRFTWRT